MSEDEKGTQEGTEAEVKKDVDPDVGGGVDRDKLEDPDFVFGDSRTFPVVTPGDVSDAVSSWGRYKGPHSFDEFKRRLMALCRRKGPEFMAAMPEEWKEEKSVDESLLLFGGAVKALGDGKVGGYLVMFGNPAVRDLTGEYFAPDTDYDTETGDRVTLYYDHGFDPTLRRRKIGRGTLKFDDAGVWVEAQLQRRDDYEKALYRMAEQGKLGWSSGTASHLVERSDDGKIVAWPLGKDASLTPTPAESRSHVLAMKSYTPVPLDVIAAAPEVVAKLASDIAAAASRTENGESVKRAALQEKQASQAEGRTMEISEERLTEMLSAAATKAVEAVLKALPPDDNRGGFATVTDMKDREAEKPFKSFGEFLQAVAVASGSKDLENIDRRLLAVKAPTGLNEGMDSAGGFLVRQEYSDRLLERTYATGLIAGRVFRMPIGANANGVKIPGIDETSRANGSRFGGIQAYWTGEGNQKTSSKPTFYQIDRSLAKLTALCYVTDELLADAVALEAYISRTFPLEMNFKVEDAIIEGTGAGMPQGILNANCLISVAKETGQAAATVKYENVQKIWSRMWSPSRANAVWLINQDVEPQLNAMALNVGTGGIPVYLPAGGLAQTPYSVLFGRPVLPVEYCSTVGTVGDIILADLSQYLMFDKGGVQTAASIHIRFDYDETAYRWIYRANGQPMWNSALTPFKGSNTLSPFIALATRS